MSLTFEEARKLEVGHTLIFRSGNPNSDEFIEAKVILVTVGDTACEVKIIEILQIGAGNTTVVGDHLVATFAELEVEPK
jgi:hypothetical protein